MTLDGCYQKQPRKERVQMMKLDLFLLCLLIFPTNVKIGSLHCNSYNNKGSNGRSDPMKDCVNINI